MKKTFKIILSALLALVMLISVGTVAFAEDEEANVTEGKHRIYNKHFENFNRC